MNPRHHFFNRRGYGLCFESCNLCRPRCGFGGFTCEGFHHMFPRNVQTLIAFQTCAAHGFRQTDIFVQRHKGLRERFWGRRGDEPFALLGNELQRPTSIRGGNDRFA